MENSTNITKYFIMSELSKKSMHGYEIAVSIEKITGRKPSPSQIYPVLNRMRSRGYLDVSSIKIGRRRIKRYKLTAKGKRFFNMMNERFELFLKSVMKSRIKVCAHCSCEIFKGAYRKKISGRRMDFCCVSCAMSYA